MDSLGGCRGLVDLIYCFSWRALTLVMPNLDGSEKTEAAAPSTAHSLLPDF